VASRVGGSDLFLGISETRVQSLGLEPSRAGRDQPLPTTGLSARSQILKGAVQLEHRVRPVRHHGGRVLPSRAAGHRVCRGVLRPERERH
jgi:hypothetical protein